MISIYLVARWRLRVFELLKAGRDEITRQKLRPSPGREFADAVATQLHHLRTLCANI